VKDATLKFATWNIGGGILGRSHQRGARASLDYYAAILEEYSPDITCLQEAHSFASGDNQPEYLAEHAGYPYVKIFPISRSHLAEDAFLTLGILSRFPIITASYQKFPNPGLTSMGPDGRQWTLLDKGYAKATIDLGDRMIGILNAHCFPLHYFRAKPTEVRFEEIWRMLAMDLGEMHSTMPTVAGIDLNYAPIQDLLAGPLRPGRYVNAFSETPTTAKGVQQDYILYTHAITLLRSTVRSTMSDHAYCQVEVKIPTRESTIPSQADTNPIERAPYRLASLRRGQ
jgi:endonuclease/exonuclease/phosphatase family metal-dependent hydrolase